MAEVQHSSTTTENRLDYWDEYYATRATTRRPCPRSSRRSSPASSTGRTASSSWAAATAATRSSSPLFGHEVIGIDGLEAAVSASSALSEALGETATFIRSAIDDPDLADRLSDGEGPKALYARFFIHAITDEEEQVLLDLAAKVTSPGDLLAVEYRTIRDQVGAKETETHYRRFVLPSTFQARALERGFEATYAVEGFGFAKFRHDDAYVARTLFRRL